MPAASPPCWGWPNISPRFRRRSASSTMIFGPGRASQQPGGRRGRRMARREQGQAVRQDRAVPINDEHPATITTQSRPRYYRATNWPGPTAHMPLQWYGGGKEQAGAAEKIMLECVQAVWRAAGDRPQPEPPASDSEFLLALHRRRSTQRISQLLPHRLGNAGKWCHGRPGIATRAFAKIVDEVNDARSSDFQRPRGRRNATRSQRRMRPA